MKTLALLALLCPASAFAADFAIACTPPTQFEDGTTIPSSPPLTFNLYAADGTKPMTKIATSTLSCRFPRTNIPAGDHFYQVTAVFEGAESSRAPVLPLIVNVSATGVVSVRLRLPKAATGIGLDQ